MEGLIAGIVIIFFIIVVAAIIDVQANITEENKMKNIEEIRNKIRIVFNRYKDIDLNNFKTNIYKIIISDFDTLNYDVLESARLLSDSNNNFVHKGINAMNEFEDSIIDLFFKFETLVANLKYQLNEIKEKEDYLMQKYGENIDEIFEEFPQIDMNSEIIKIIKGEPLSIIYNKTCENWKYKDCDFTIKNNKIFRYKYK